MTSENAWGARMLKQHCAVPRHDKPDGREFEATGAIFGLHHWLDVRPISLLGENGAQHPCLGPGKAWSAASAPPSA